jgi:hypothetical protein
MLGIALVSDSQAGFWVSLASIGVFVALAALGIVF